MYPHDIWGASLALTALIALAALLLTFGLQMFVHRRLGAAPSDGRATDCPVSVLRPVKGADPELVDNLRALLQQDHPAYEVIVGIADLDDPALPLVRQLMREPVGARLKLVLGAPELNANPKVNNLRHMVRFAQHSVILISDADVRPEPNYLSTIVAELQHHDAALVHNLVVSCCERAPGALLEASHMNLFVTGGVAGADALLGRQCVIGKSMLLRLERFESIGGWPAIANVLAEDYVTGSLLQQAGERVVLSRHVLRTANPGRSVASFVNRHLRWAQMRRQLGPLAYYFEPLGLPYVWIGLTCLVATLSSSEAWTIAVYIGVGVAVLLRLAADYWLSLRLLGKEASMLPALCAPVKDFIILGVWLTACFRRQVFWRGTRMLIGPGSLVIPIPKDAEVSSSHGFSRVLRGFLVKG